MKQSGWFKQGWLEKIWSKKLQSGLKITLINLLVLFVFLELGSLIFYFFRNQQLFYTRERTEDYRDLGVNLEGVRFGTTVAERLHPFFGFVHQPGPDFRVGFKYNNYGFISPYDYPFVKENDNQFIVGVFGGSVASNYSIYEVQSKLLEQAIQKQPGFESKEVIILSFAVGGYKQPQQMLILNYLLSMGQEFDLVINLDGFNEVALNTLNNKRQLALSMPSASHIEPLTSLANNSLSEKAMRTLLKIKDNKQKIGNSLESLQHCWLASCYAINSLRTQVLVKDYRKNLQRFERQRLSPDDESGSIIYFYTQNDRIPDEEFYQQAASYWGKTSMLMSQILAENDIPYLHVLQPNQYWQTERQFNEAEKEIAFSENSPYEKGVRIGYPFLLDEVKNLQQNQINILNAVNIFDQESEPVYTDNCCHYNPKGEEILSNFIAQEAVKQIQE
ncbi:MAG: hypothetical protein ACFBSC_08235 [Microcoleaceae cyanobacterium]